MRGGQAAGLRGWFGSRHEVSVNRLLLVVFSCTLGLTTPAAGYSLYGEENPFVEAMLRMMEIFGLIDRDRLPLGVPYLPGYGQALAPGLGLGGMSGFAGYPGVAAMPGISPLYGTTGLTGISPIAGMGGVPGVSQIPGAGAWPGAGLPPVGGTPGYWPGQAWPGAVTGMQPAGRLDGVWEISKGGFVIIRGNAARLYVSRDRYQDFAIGYDRRYLWWAPRGSGASSNYRYQVRDGRMILRDADGNYLLLRRRR